MWNRSCYRIGSGSRILIFQNLWAAYTERTNGSYYQRVSKFSKPFTCRNRSFKVQYQRHNHTALSVKIREQICSNYWGSSKMPAFVNLVSHLSQHICDRHKFERLCIKLPKSILVSRTFTQQCFIIPT